VTVPVVLASSTQAAQDNPYGRSKRAAEDAVRAYGIATGAPAHLLRLPNVFGKWCKPNYNSAVATFCHNTARGLPIQVNDPAAPVTLVYVDDVVQRFVQLMDGADAANGPDGFAAVAPQYTTTVGELARLVQTFKDSRTTLMTERVGTGHEHELCTSGAKTEVVETVPGWTHDITNTGTDEMVVMLWANEVFDREKPDTFACPL
jgi:UDP-2-acetamido-2,6-beta-L-arabino-hexul-4-ose reductase